jgi:hypothetical protein
MGGGVELAALFFKHETGVFNAAPVPAAQGPGQRDSQPKRPSKLSKSYEENGFICHGTIIVGLGLVQPLP